MTDKIYGSVQNGSIAEVRIGGEVFKAGIAKTLDETHMAFMAKVVIRSIPADFLLNGKRARAVKRLEASVTGMQAFAIELID